MSAGTRAEILNGSAAGTSAKLLSSSLSLQGDARAVSRCLLMPSFSAFTGHLPCCRWRLMDPRGLMIPHFFLPQLWMAASRACLWLSSLPEWKAFANPSDGSEGYGKEISKPRWGLGFHSPKQLICGDLRFSSSPNGGDYKPIRMSTCPLIEDKSQEGGTVC